MSEMIREKMTEDIKEINAQDVIAFLRDHPEFLQLHPDAIDLLIPPAQGDGRTVRDFQSYMIERLKADKKEIVDGTKELIANARSNMNNQQRIHRAVLHLLEARNFDDFVHGITMDLSSLLNVDISVLIVESGGTDIPHINRNGIRVVPGGTIDRGMDGKSVLLQDHISGIEAVYGGGATLVRSQIMLRVDISMDTPPAIIAFGSRDPDAFHEGQATDQILFLARVIERCFRTWLTLPA